MPKPELEHLMPNIITHRLSIDKLVVQYGISAHVLENAKLEYLYNSIIDVLIARLSTHIACSETKSVKTQFPSNIWQHIKAKYSPKWFTRKYPVKFQEVKINCKEMFPDLNISKNRRYFDVALVQNFKLEHFREKLYNKA